MAMLFRCACGKQLPVKEEYAGLRVRCPVCGQESVLPENVSEAVQSAEATPKVGREERYEEGSDDRPRHALRVGSRQQDEDEDGDHETPQAPGQTSGKATAAFVLGLLSFCLTIFTGIPAVILGIQSLRDIDRSRERLRGRGLAIAGIVTGGVGIVLVLPAFLAALLVPAVQKVREAATRMNDANNMKQMCIAMYWYHDSTGKLPEHGAICDPNGKPLLSWRVALLPYLEQDHLYQQFKLDEPWDSPHNMRFVQMMPKVYAHPTDPDAARQGLTCYRVFVGPQSAFAPRDNRPPGIPRSIPDGTSNTIMIVEAADPVIWTKPDESPTRPMARCRSSAAGSPVGSTSPSGTARFVSSIGRDSAIRRCAP